MVDNNGYIVDTNGNFVYGFRAVGDGTTETTLKELRLPDVMTLDAKGDLPSSFSYGATTASGVSLSTTVEINSLGKIMATVKVIPDGSTEATETRTIEIGQVALATFQNPNGLAKVGGNYYQTSADDNAGQVAASKPGEGGTASLMTGYIEASNVDLAKEFSDMIMTQRGFQANSKMITVGDEMLQELVNMKR